MGLIEERRPTVHLGHHCVDEGPGLNAKGRARERSRTVISLLRGPWTPRDQRSPRTLPGHDGGLDFLMARLNKHLLPQAAPHRQFVTAVRQTSNTRTLGVFSVHFLRFSVLEIRTHAKSPDGAVCEVPRVGSTLQQIGKVSLDRERAHCGSHRGLINLCSLYISLQLWLT